MQLCSHLQQHQKSRGPQISTAATAAASTSAVQTAHALVTARSVLPVKKFHQQQQQQQQQLLQQDVLQRLPPQQQPQHSDVQAVSGPSSNSNKKQQHGLHQTLHALRSTGVTSADAARAAPHLLTSAVVQCETLGEGLQVFWEMSPAFNNVHVTAMVTRLAKIVRSTTHQQLQQQQQLWQQQPWQQQQPQQPCSSSSSSSGGPVTSSLTPAEQGDLQQLLTDLSQLSEELLPTCSHREMSNLAWGFAALGLYNRRLMQLLLGRCTLTALNPQELSNLTWAVAKLGHEVSGVWVDEVLLLSGRGLAAGLFKPQEAANIAWGLAVIQRRCLTATVPAAAGSGSSSSSSWGGSCYRVDEQWKQGFCRAMPDQLGFWGAADVSQGLWALAVLGYSYFDRQWLDRVLVRGLQLLGEGRMQSRHAGSMMWAVAKLHQQQQWAATAAAGQASSSSSSTVSPTVAVFAAAVASKLPLLLHQERQPLHFAAVLLYSCQLLRLQPQAAALDALLAAAARQLGSLDLPSAAAHAGEAGRTNNPYYRQQQQQQQPGLMLDLSMLLYSLTQLSYRPQQQFMDLVAAVVADRAWRVVDCHDQLAALEEAWHALRQQQQQQQQEPGAHALVQQQQRQHPGQDHGGNSSSAESASKQQHILYQRQQLLQELQSSWRGRETSLLLWAMGKLQYQAPSSLLRPFKMACLRQRSHINAADVGIMFWALARTRHRPGYLWVRYMLEHFLARIDDRVQGVADVCNVVHALPHLPGGANQHYCLRQKVGQEVLQGLADAAAARFPDCGPRELVQLVQGFALLGYRPGGFWVQQHQQRVAEVGRAAFSDREWQLLQLAYEWMRSLSAEDDVRLDAEQQQPPCQQELPVADLVQ